MSLPKSFNIKEIFISSFSHTRNTIYRMEELLINGHSYFMLSLEVIIEFDPGIKVSERMNREGRERNICSGENVIIHLIHSLALTSPGVCKRKIVL